MTDLYIGLLIFWASFSVSLVIVWCIAYVIATAVADAFELLIRTLARAYYRRKDKR